MAGTNRDSLLDQLVGEPHESNEAVITEIERRSPLWLKIKAHMGKRVATLRARNDTDKAPDATAKLRGRIAELKNLMALDNPAPSMEADDSE